ncbi:hypothetical protein [Nocardia sp. GTS18]|uniref:hypothetical protein n=1 Tax=unclassified Nocardia TaxID=2637762 RepID=UPI0015EF9DCC|nr:hypothetical protein [Nocardia sp. GTS18]
MLVTSWLPQRHQHATAADQDEYAGVSALSSSVSLRWFFDAVAFEHPHDQRAGGTSRPCHGTTVAAVA